MIEIVVSVCVFKHFSLSLHWCRCRVQLEERIEYLSRAMLCAKSCNLPTSASREGEFLHELEERMEVGMGQGGRGRGEWVGSLAG